jgi:hypothetical protein
MNFISQARRFLLLGLLSLPVLAQELPPTHYKLNPRWQMKADGAQSHADGAQGFNSVFQNKDYEVHARGTQITDEKAAKQMGEVELTNIQKIFDSRRNPYEGQITDVIQCDKSLKPRPFTFKIGSQEVHGIMAGANTRKIFGSCSYDQLDYWASYFNFYDAQSHMLLEFRIFKKVSAAKPSQIPKLSNELTQVSKDLLQR